MICFSVIIFFLEHEFDRTHTLMLKLLNQTAHCRAYVLEVLLFLSSFFKNSPLDHNKQFHSNISLYFSCQSESTIHRDSESLRCFAIQHWPNQT